MGDLPKIIQYLTVGFHFKCTSWTFTDFFFNDNVHYAKNYWLKLDEEYVEKYVGRYKGTSAVLFVTVNEDKSGFYFGVASNGLFETMPMHYFLLDQDGEFDHNEVNEFLSNNLQVRVPVPIFEELSR